MEEAKARIGNGTEIGRRDFLGLGAAAAASVFMPVLKAGICADLPGDASSARFDDNLVAFLADIHAGAEKKCSVARRKFKETVDEILAMRPLPRNVLVFGDIAYRCGLGEDYDFSRPLFRKLEDAGIAVTIGMGNHDRRSEYAKRWPEAAAKSLVPGRYVHLVETPHLDFLMLDSLQGADERPLDDMGPGNGALDEAQQGFLADFVKGRTRPLVICAHHGPGDLSVNGVPMVEFFTDNPCVAGYVHGHNHRWLVSFERCRKEPTPQHVKHVLWLPSVGLWGAIGYSICRVYPDKAVVEPLIRDFWLYRPVPQEKRPPEWDDLLAEAKASSSCTMRFHR